MNALSFKVSSSEASTSRQCKWEYNALLYKVMTWIKGKHIRLTQISISSGCYFHKLNMPLLKTWLKLYRKNYRSHYIHELHIALMGIYMTSIDIYLKTFLQWRKIYYQTSKRCTNSTGGMSPSFKVEI